MCEVYLEPTRPKRPAGRAPRRDRARALDVAGAKHDMTVNLNALDDVDPADVKVIYWDGRHDNWEAGSRDEPGTIFADAASRARAQNVLLSPRPIRLRVYENSSSSESFSDPW
jgi:hypothetical protein